MRKRFDHGNFAATVCEGSLGGHGQLPLRMREAGLRLLSNYENVRIARISELFKSTKPIGKISRKLKFYVELAAKKGLIRYIGNKKYVKVWRGL